MKKVGVIVALVVLVAMPSKVGAWSMTGHRIITEIASQNMKPNTKKKIDKLLNNMPPVYWSNWADFIKSDKTGKYDHTHVWHFVNTPANLSKEDFVTALKEVKQENLYSEIGKLEKVLLDKNTSELEKQEAFYFLIHLVGDAHQPMHVGRAEDLGGNRIPLMWFNEKTNLHAFWDGKLVDYMKYSYSEYANLLNTISKDQKKNLGTGTLEDWLYESHCLANEIYAGVNPNDRLSYDYAYKYTNVVELQLQRAGLRLATLLDKLFK